MLYGDRPPHRWRRRDAARYFVIGYVATAGVNRVEQHLFDADFHRYEAAVFECKKDSDSALLWVADETGPQARSVQGVHGGIRRNLWEANREAIEWVRIVEELGDDAAELRAFAAFSEFEHAVDGLVGATLASVPHDLLDDPTFVSEERSFDLSGQAPNLP